MFVTLPFMGFEIFRFTSYGQDNFGMPDFCRLVKKYEALSFLFKNYIYTLHKRLCKRTRSRSKVLVSRSAERR